MTTPYPTTSFPPADVGHFAPQRGRSRVGAAAVAAPVRGHAVTDSLTHLRPAEMTPAERAAAIVALLAAGPRSDLPGVEQDLAVALLDARSGFNPGRGSAAYAETVVRNAAELTLGRFAAKRHPGRVVRLAALADEPADATGNAVECVPDGDTRPRPRSAAMPSDVYRYRLADHGPPEDAKAAPPPR